MGGNGGNASERGVGREEGKSVPKISPGSFSETVPAAPLNASKEEDLDLE